MLKRRPFLCISALLSFGLGQSTSADWDVATSKDGVKIHFDTVGAGTPLFLVAGGPGRDSSCFRFTHTLLQTQTQLAFIDNRGRGKSIIPQGKSVEFSLKKDVEDIEAVRQKIGAPRIIILGHSYGAMVALAYAVKYPNHTLGLISVSGCHGATVWQDRNIETVKRHLQQHYPDRWKKVVELHERGSLTGVEPLSPMFENLNELLLYNPESDWRLYPQFYKNGDRVEFNFSREVYLAMIGPDPEWTIGGTLAGVELLPILNRFPGPALVIGGRHDRISPPLNQFEIADALPKGELTIFERSSHSPSVEEPLRFIRVVSEFITRVEDQK